MELDKIFDVFSRRNRGPDPCGYGITSTTRNKILLFCHDVFSGKLREYDTDCLEDFWGEIHSMLQYRHGRARLYEKPTPSRDADTAAFLSTCKDDEFLDFVEYILKVRCIWRFDSDAVVDGVNKIFASENVGYELTHPVLEETTVPGDYMIRGPHTSIKTIAYPQIIRKDNEVIHTEVIKPALQLITDPKYKTANQEYLDALEDYRKADYGDCLTKCCSAFESVMKIICDKKGWNYSQNDPAGTLVTAMMKNLKIDPFFQPTLMIIATLRNRLSSSHGAGTEPRAISQNLARYALNMTASAIVFLVNEAR